MNVSHSLQKRVGSNMEKKSSNVFGKICCVIGFLLMQAATAGLVIGILAFATDGSWISTGNTESDFYVTFASLIVIIDLIVIALFTRAKQLRKSISIKLSKQNLSQDPSKLSD